MNRAASTSLPAADVGERWRRLFPVLVLFGAIVTATGAIIGNGNLLVAMAPMALLIVLWAIWRAPLRIPVFWTMFLALALDATGDGPWDSPLASLGALLDLNLNRVLPVAALRVPGLAVILGCFLVIHAHRRLSGSRIDGSGRLGVAPAIMWAIACSSLTVLIWSALGYARGGDLQMVKIQVQIYLMILAAGCLLAVTMRGMRDFRILAVIVVAAACIKALLALYVAGTVAVPTGGELGFATSHGDSVLFACAVTILVVHLAEKPTRRSVLACLLLLPLVVAGLLANNRRIAWAEIGAVVVLFFVMARPSRFKRFVIRGFLLALPLVIVYVAVGWSSGAKIFAPVRTFRSMQDAQVDSSTMFREIENFNLLQTRRLHPWVGSGFGHPFVMVAQTPDLSFFKEYPYMPHNSILGLWASTGVFGFTALFMVLNVCVLLAARSYYRARSPDERTAAFVAIAMVLIYEIHCWGDIGFSERRSIFLVGAACAVASRLAVSTRAWGYNRHHGALGQA